MNNILYAVAGDILAAISDAFAMANPAVSLPDRQYVTTGGVAWDIGTGCDEQLVVTITRIFGGLPGVEQGFGSRCDVPNTAEFHAQLVRCVPPMGSDGSAPSSAALDASGERLAVDGWLLAHAVPRFFKCGALLSRCDSLVNGPVVAVGPQGGVAGWDLTVVAQIDTKADIEPCGAS